MMEADQDGDGKLDFEEFKAMVANTDIAKQMVRLLVYLHMTLALLLNLSPGTDAGGYARLYLASPSMTLTPPLPLADMW